MLFFNGVEFGKNEFIETDEEFHEIDMKRYYPKYDITSENYCEILKAGDKYYIVSNELAAHAELPDDIAEIFENVFILYEENNWYGYYSYEDYGECVEGY